MNYEDFDPNQMIDTLSIEDVESNAIYGREDNLSTLLKACQYQIAPLVYSLSKSDYLIFCLYIRSNLTQSQIASLMDRSQASISKRFMSLKSKLRVLLSMPSRNILEVHQDMHHIFGENSDMIEVALVSYFEFGGVTRIKTYIEASSAGMIKKQKRMLVHLESRAEEDFLSKKYLEYFTLLYDSSGTVSFYDNSNIKDRKDSVVKGASCLV